MTDGASYLLFLPLIIRPLHYFDGTAFEQRSQERAAVNRQEEAVEGFAVYLCSDRLTVEQVDNFLHG